MQQHVITDTYIYATKKKPQLSVTKLKSVLYILYEFFSDVDVLYRYSKPTILKSVATISRLFGLQ